jgi:hypothetical protein
MKTVTDLHGEVERTRARRSELLAERTKIDRAPVSLDVATQRIDEYLAALASEPGAMTHRFLRPGANGSDLADVTLGLMDGPTRGVGARDILRSLAFLDRERLRLALVADAKAALEASGGGLSERERTEALAAIEAELLELEVAEELAIREAEDAGHEGLDRRGDAEPRVVLWADPAALLRRAAA